MTGYMIALGACWSCGRIFGFNPERVPSIPIRGVRQPICRDCVEASNPLRIKNGLPPIVPLPGAYDEQESE